MKTKVAVIGLGYVGLPVLSSISGRVEVVGFDVNEMRIEELSAGYDRTGEVTQQELDAIKATYSSSPKDCEESDIYIVTVPTPVNTENEPDCSHLIEACKMVGKQIKNGAVVIFESTVYPGLTREICIPILEHSSNFKCCRDFHVGYSPERINPGDKTRRLKDIVKVTSGCCDISRAIVDQFYSELLDLKTYSASSLEVAEAAKVIENTQRDINIALMNELSEIFQKAGIDTNEVIEAASTKWNFHAYVPGLVGGHCIGVDPYYLSYKAKILGVEPKMILAGREVNNAVTERILNEVLNHKQRLKDPNNFKVLILGASFKEDCPDVRNSKSLELFEDLRNLDIDVSICDPIADFNCKDKLWEPTEFGVLGKYDFIIITVSHSIFLQLEFKKLRQLLKENGKIYDVKSIFDKADTDYRL
jgi:UDP-N-acetyl-D-glucosamine/UDP-N-acetyl-D-galactosamine dehydrogenase